jgi:hypothetical protein
MLSKISKPSERKLKASGQASDEVQIRLAPLPEEKREAYRESMRVIATILIEIVNEKEKQDLYIDIFAKKVCVER